MKWAGVPRWADALVIVLVKLGVSSGVLAAGFSAVSDDDYSRIVIAQQFAEAPRLDPSGTSWLPFPFWIHGAAHALLGPSLDVARGVALAFGACAALLAWGAMRLLRAPRGAALLGAVLASALPYSAWLGAAAVPEALSAGLVVFGLATLCRSDTRLRLSGALCLSLACLSRYEAWPAALAFTAFSLADSRRQRALLGPAALSLAAPLLRMLHGAWTHDDALFFVQRVTNYRAALGGVEAGFFERLAFYPLALLRFEPELVAVSVVAFLTLRLGRLGAELATYRRLLFGLACVLGALVFGSLRGGVPTHHAERALLALWVALALFCADVLWRAFAGFGGRARLVLACATLMELGGGLLLRPLVAQREPFSDRHAELSIGREARLQGARHLLIATEDYGYFAVMASYGWPSRAKVLRDHDPRRPSAEAPFSSARSLENELGQRGARWLVAARRHAPLLEGLGRIAAKNERFVLLEVKR